MKKQAWLLVIFFMPSAFFFLSSCEGADCNCAPIEGSYFRTTAMDLTFLKAQGTNAEQQLAEGDSIRFENLEMEINFEVEYYNVASNHVDWRSLTNSAWALDCECASNGQAGSEEQLDSLIFTTDFDLDASHPAGSTINDLLELRQFGNTLAFEDLPMLQLYSPEFKLFFKNQITPQQLQLTARAYFNDGKSYTNTSPLVYSK